MRSRLGGKRQGVVTPVDALVVCLFFQAAGMSVFPGA